MENNPWGNGSPDGANGHRSGFAWKATMAFGWVLFLLLLCVFAFWQMAVGEEASVNVKPGGPAIVTDIPLPELSGSDQLGAAMNRTIEVNGQLKVNSSLVISPADPPENPVKGQVYYDESTNAPMYYDGKKFVGVAKQDDVALLQSVDRQSSVTVLQTINNTTVTVTDDPAPSPNNLQLSSNGFLSTLTTSALTTNRSIMLADESGIVCLQGSVNCGFVTGSPANFIQSQDTGAQAGSSYWVAGVGRADGGIIAPSVDTAGSGTLTIGSNAGAVDINADTTVNGRLGASINSSVLNVPLLQLEQDGSGDATIELKDSDDNSFYFGMDRSAGGALRIGSSTAARTTNPVGNPGAGGLQFQGVENQIIARKVVTGPADSGSISSVAMHLTSVDGAAGGLKVAVYSHDAANNRPGTLLASTSTATAGTVGWNVIPVSAAVSANTTYWVAVNIEGSGSGLSFNYCGGCAAESTTTYPRPFNNAWPTPHGVPNNALSDYEWSIYMNVATGSVTDTYAGAKLFSMTSAGAITLQNSIDTSSAFQVQDAAGVALFNVNSATGVLTVRELVATYDLTVGGDISFGRHVRSGGSSPTTVTGPAACSAPTVTVSGTDTAGIVTVVAGTGCATDGVITTVSFAEAFGSAPKVTLTPATAAAANLPVYVDYAQVTTASFGIATSTALADAVTYRWYYHVIE